MQEYIELCRIRKVPEAIVYSRKNLAPWAATHLVELQQATPPLHDLDDILTNIYADSIGSPPVTATEPLDIETGNIDCPSCDVNLRVLTGQIPMSHHVNSTIVCRISGEVMDSENEPLA